VDRWLAALSGGVGETQARHCPGWKAISRRLRIAFTQSGLKILCQTLSQRVYRPIGGYLEFPDMVVTARGLLEATAVPRRSPGT
jgi:hypothetical protein